jgi:hypothetical protein
MGLAGVTVHRDASDALLSLWDALNATSEADERIQEALPACHFVGPVLSTVLFRAGVRTALPDAADAWDIAWLVQTATMPLRDKAAHLLALSETEALIHAELAGDQQPLEEVRTSDRNAFFTAQVTTRQIFWDLARAGRATELGLEIVAVGSQLRRDDWLLEELRRTHLKQDHPSWGEGFEGLAVGVEALSRRMSR